MDIGGTGVGVGPASEAGSGLESEPGLLGEASRLVA